jgi:DNA-binding LytR/AlgR family response regulator
MIKGTIAIKDRGIIRPINLNDIIVVEVDIYQCVFYLENGEKLHLVQSLKETLSLLPSESFMQIRRDTIINLNKIVMFKDNKVYLKSKHEYCIPFRKRKMIKDMLLKP